MYPILATFTPMENDHTIFKFKEGSKQKTEIALAVRKQWDRIPNSVQNVGTKERL